MKPAPYLLFVALVGIFLYGFIQDKMLLAFIVLLIALTPFLFNRIRKSGINIGSLKIPKFTKNPIFFLLPNIHEKKYSASALMLSTAKSEDRGDRFANELNYERLSKFSEALGSLGVPAAYVSLSLPNFSISGEKLGGSVNRSFVIVWSSGTNETELANRSEIYFRQLEGICSIALPKVLTKRMEKDEISTLLASPLHIALPKLIPFYERLKSPRQPLQPVPLPPPPNSPDPSALFLKPEEGSLNGDGPFLGWVYSDGKQVAPLSLNLEDLQKHMSIFGATGGGKSTTAISLALRLFSMGVPVLILDWHGEHSKIVSEADGKVFSPGSPNNGITLNPLSVSIAKDIGFQVEFVTDIFSQIFQFTPPQSYMFREAIKSCYNSKVNPTLSDLISELGLLPIRSSWDHETRMALMRRLKFFTEGTCGMAVNGPDSLPRVELFKGLVSIDLSYLKDVNSRSIMANLIMKIIYDFSVSRGEQVSLRHVTILEEAQNILPPRRPDVPRSIGERTLGEIRKYGEGVIVISQFPSGISMDVIKNTAVRIIHAIRSGDDLKILGDSTSLSEEQRVMLTLLCRGEAVVNLPYRSSNLFVKVMPDPLLEMAATMKSDPSISPHLQV